MLIDQFSLYARRGRDTDRGDSLGDLGDSLGDRVDRRSVRRDRAIKKEESRDRRERGDRDSSAPSDHTIHSLPVERVLESTVELQETPIVHTNK